MFRYVLFVVFGAVAVTLAILWHVNPLFVIVFLALGALMGSNGENEVGYNFIDWLIDHLRSLFGSFKNYGEAKINTLEKLSAKVSGQIAAEQAKITGAVKRAI